MIQLSDLSAKLGEISASIKDHFNFKAQAETNATARDAAIAERDAANTAKATAEASLAAEQTAHTATKAELATAKTALAEATAKLTDPKGAAAKAVAAVAAEAGVPVAELPKNPAKAEAAKPELKGLDRAIAAHKSKPSTN